MKRMITGLAVLMMITGLLTGAFASGSVSVFPGVRWGCSSDLVQMVMGEGITMGNTFRMVMRYDSVEYKGQKATALLYFDKDKLYQIQLLVITTEAEDPGDAILSVATAIMDEYGRPVMGKLEDADEGNAVERKDGDCLLWITEDTGIWMGERGYGMADIRFRKLK